MDNEVLVSTLISNLDSNTGKWLPNLDSLSDNLENLYGFEHTGVYHGPALMLNGADSY